MKSENKGFKHVVKSLRNCVKLIRQYNRAYIIVTGILTIFQGMAPVISIRIMQQIVNSIQLQDKEIEYVFFLLLIYVLFGGLNAISMEFYTYYSNKTRLEFSKFTESLLLAKALELKISDYENDETYNIINRAQNQGGNAILDFFDSIVNIVKALVTICSSLYILSKYNLYVVFIVIIIPVIQYLYSLKIGKLQYDISMKRTEKERRAWYINFIIMTGNAFKEIKLNGLGTYLITKYEAIRKEIVNTDVKILKNNCLVNSVLTLLDHCVSGGVMANLIYKGFNKIILLGDLTTYSNCIYAVKNNVTSIFSLISSIVKESMFITLFFEFLSLETETDNGKIIISEIMEIELVHLSYKYQGCNEYALYDINIFLKKGDILGIVGENGSGKSTLIKLILGFYDNYEGEILINKIPMEKINKENYMKKIGSVFQDYVKYEADIRENVAFGNIAEINNDSSIREALKFAEVNGHLYKENDLNTMLGNWFGKKQVSIGEWQRIAIARAFIKNADMYVLDEPDASLDVLTEKKMLEKYKQIMEENIGILITHKVFHVHLLATKIIVLEKGKVVEYGSHENLLSERGKYYKLYKND